MKRILIFIGLKLGELAIIAIIYVLLLWEGAWLLDFSGDKYEIRRLIGFPAMAIGIDILVVCLFCLVVCLLCELCCGVFKFVKWNWALAMYISDKLK